ncbi:MAG: hypothetical protein ACTHU0_23720, partial [Kofleriaceae bacterium]
MRFVFGAVAVAAIATAACSGTQTRPDEVGCTKDTDCRTPRVCERRACVDPRPVAGGSPEA